MSIVSDLYEIKEKIEYAKNICSEEDVERVLNDVLKKTKDSIYYYEDDGK